MSVRNTYTTRRYNLVANQPQALPAAREFLIVSASVDITALNIALDDNNGALETWTYGFAVGVKEGTTKARVMSTVSQTVTITMATGAVTVKDSRFAPGAGSLAVTIADGADEALGEQADPVAASDDGAASLISLVKRLLTKTQGTVPWGTRFRQTNVAGGAAVVTNLVAAAANINGILVNTATLVCGADPTANAQLLDTLSAFVEVFDSHSTSVGGIIIPAGQNLTVSVTGLSVVTGAYTIL